ncbi:MAG: hypothetical protein LBS81_04725 [Endomicrobium sp.]|nr:hypothetical protein [Endomicrobium sp.]
MKIIQNHNQSFSLSATEVLLNANDNESAANNPPPRLASLFAAVRVEFNYIHAAAGW